MKRKYLGKVCVTVMLALCFIMQGCFASKPVEFKEPEASVSVSSTEATVSAEPEASTETTVSVSEEASAEEATEEPEPETEIKEERPEGVFLRLTQSGADDPLVIDIYEDGSYISYPKNNPTEPDKGYWNFSNGGLCLAAATDELVVNELSLGADGFTYVAYGSAGFPQRIVKDKASFADSDRTITAAEFEEYQQKLGGAPFHARFPSEYAKTDDAFLGAWKDQSGMFVVNIFKASAEVGGYSFTIKDVFGNELGGGDAHIEGEGLVMHQGTGALKGDIACSAEKSDTGITVTLDSKALVNYGIPAGDEYNIYLTR